MLYVRMVIVMERGNRKFAQEMAILKQSCPVQRKCTTTERTVFQLANLDGSLCFF